ncbi:hypothetical protein ACWD4G_11035 [Streptomyces sp. NPDC002643]
MQRLPGGRGAPSSRGRHSAPPSSPRLRLVGLCVAVAFALAVPLVASAGPVDDAHLAERSGTAENAPSSDPARGAARADDADGRGGDTRAGGAAEGALGLLDPKPGGLDGRDTDGTGGTDDYAGAGRVLGLGLATAAQCGPELTSPDGIEAQTCVLSQGEETWARTYYRNATGRKLRSVLSMMAPGGRTVRMHCSVGAEDEPGACETPRERTRGEMGAYSAVAEFAAPDGSGPLLLRSGSNSARS